MDTSAVRGLAFFGILFVASLLLADRKLLRPRQDPEQRFWLVRPGYRRQARALDRLLIASFSALGGWLVFSHIQAQLPDVEPARVEQAITLRAR